MYKTKKKSYCISWLKSEHHLQDDSNISTEDLFNQIPAVTLPKGVGSDEENHYLP